MLAFLKKRRVRWVLASILVILLGGGALLYWYSRASLADFVGIDLRTLDDTHPTALGKFLNGILPDQFPGPRTKLNQVLARTLPEEFKPQKRLLGGFEPWYLWRLERNNHSRFILFEAEPLFVIPSGSTARIHFFDSNGRYQSTTEFGTGWRIQILDASLFSYEILGDPLIEVISGPSILGESIRRQYYGISKNRAALLRLEDENGKLAANSYEHSHWRLGPSPPVRTKGEWTELLNSLDSKQVLEALTWIGGHHRMENVWNGSGSVVAAVRNSPAVQKRIGELTVSENQWIREAAVLAQEQLPKKAIP